MSTCARYQELLLDHLYGLLDEPEADLLRGHLAECAECQAALDRVTVEKTRIAQAARAISDVPAFRIPEHDPLDTPVSPTAITTLSQPASSADPRPRRGVRTLLWLVGAALSACVLVAVTLNYQYRTQRDTQVAVVQNLQRQISEVDAKVVSINQRFGNEERQQVTVASTDVNFRQMQLCGPNQIVPGIASDLKLLLCDPSGKAKDGTVEVDLVNEQGETLVAKQRIAVNGVTPVPIAPPAGWTGNARLRSTFVQPDGAIDKLEEPVQIQSTNYASHLVTNKLNYRAGDHVLVRALVVDRYTLKPPTEAQEVELRVLNEQNQPALPPVRVPTVQGMAAAEFALPAPLAEGNYSVQARGEQIAPLNRRIEVIPPIVPPVDLANVNNNPVRAGDEASIAYQLFNRDGTPAANTAYRIVFDRGGQNLTQNAAVQNNAMQVQQLAPPGDLRGKTDSRGIANFAVRTEKDAQASRQQVRGGIVYGPAKKEETARFQRDIQVIPQKLAIDLYPEGGNLVAGVPNRVYYRVRSLSGDTVPPEGAVLVYAGKQLVYESNRGQDLGVFTFVPDPNEKYRVRITAPMEQDIQNPFPGIEREGILIRGDGVQTGNQPIRLTLENRGADRVAQVIVSCRGQIVYHQRVTVGSEPVALEITTPVDGIHRVTVLEVRPTGLVPQAERLVFREPSQRLDLDVTLEQTTLTPGQKRVNMRVTGKNESGKPHAFWALASVTDERLAGDQPEPGLRSHFLLLDDVAPEAADLAELPLQAGPAASDRKRLDVALGVIGWRRLQQSPAANELARGTALAQSTPTPAATPLTFFYRVQPSLEELRRRTEQRWLVAQEQLIDTTRANQAAWVRSRTELEQKLRSARVTLGEMEEQPRRAIQLGMGILVLTLLSVGVLSLVWGMARLVRGHSATATFGTACACIAACLFVFLARPDGMIEPAVQEAVALTRPEVQDIRPGMRPRAEAVMPIPQDAQVQMAPAQEMREGAAVGALARQPGAEGIPPGEPATRVARFNNDLNRRAYSAPAPFYADQTTGARSATLERELGQVAGRGQEPGGFGGGGAPGAGAPGGGGGFAAPKPPAFAAKKAGSLDSMKTVPLAPKATRGSEGAKEMKAKEVAKKADAFPPPPGPVPPQAAPAASLPPGNVPRPMAKKKGDESQDKNLSMTESDAARARIDLSALPREFAVRSASDLADPTTLLWSPALAVPATGLSVPIELPPGVAAYRVLLFGHTPEGRFGFVEDRLQVKEAGR